MRSRGVVAGVVAALCVSCSGSTSKPATAPTVPLTHVQLARFSLTGQPDWLATDGKTLYVREDSGAVNAIDPQTNRVLWRLQVEDGLCQGLTYGFGSLWTCAPDDITDTDDLVRIDPRSRRITGTFKVGKSNREGRIVTGFGRVWVINSTPAGSSLVGVDPTSGKTDAPIPLGMLAVDLAINGRFVWAVGSVANRVVGVDVTARKVVRRIDGLGWLSGPSIMATGDSALLWVSGEKGTAGIDPDAQRVVVRIPLGAKGFGGLVATASDLWIHADDPFLARYDPSNGHLRERIVAPDLPNPGDVLFAFGSLWASANNQSTLVRVRV